MDEEASLGCIRVAHHDDGHDECSCGLRKRWRAKDSLGIPRCLIKPVDCTGTDGGTPPKQGDTCATSADCCGTPCINNICGGANSCGKVGETCTTSADCCPGIPCVQAPGSSKGVGGGTLQSDGGVIVVDAGTTVDDAGTSSDASTPPPVCALYGQICSIDGDCCNAVPCTGGRCRFPDRGRDDVVT